MKFRTEYNTIENKYKLNVELPVTLIGSCFSDNIGRRMRESLWDARHNPCGALYNPVSIMTILTALSIPEPSQKALLESSVVMKDGIWVSWLFDSEFAGATEKECMAVCLGGLRKMRESIAKSQVLIVTLGTSYYYSLVENGAAVANCHKFPSSCFIKRRLSVEDTRLTCLEIVSLARRINPEIHVIFTVSPVRHLKDGMHENTLSKSILLLGVDEAMKEMKNCSYFAAYEILNDDLRDYRFYASDLSHPSDEAVEYIWGKFKDEYLDQSGRELLKEGCAIRQRLSHRPIVEGTESGRRFAEETETLRNRFIAAHPGMLDK